jgi:glycosyltransferase involved in cell wall biosynthesis
MVGRCDACLSMNVLQVPFTYYPESCGGTEIYVQALAQRLEAHRIESVIAAPARQDAAMEHRGLRVRLYALNEKISNLRDLYGEGDAAAASSFDRVLEEERPALVHLHAQTPGVSLRVLRAAQRRHVPVVYTYHTPTATCLRGTLLRWGNNTCDGAMTEHLCAACSLQGRGVNRLAAHALAALPPAVGGLLGRAGLQGRIWTAVRARELVALRQRCARAFLAEANHIVAVCEWVRAVLRRNGVPAEKITLCRQGVSEKAESETRKPKNSSALQDTCSDDQPLCIVYLGRLDPTKGVHLLLRAVRAVPEVKLSVDIFGIAQGPGGAAYADRLRRLAAGDARITLRGPIPASRAVETLRGYDLLAVPSQWLETGPMVVLEAFAAGVPVLGSRLGGIAELVRDGVDGVLVEAADVNAWSAALRRLATQPEVLPRLRKGVRPPRTMDAAAAEMAALYRRLVGAAQS